MSDPKLTFEMNDIMNDVNAQIWGAFGFSHEHNSSTCAVYKNSCNKCYEIYQANTD